jgi:hypothetical protein
MMGKQEQCAGDNSTQVQAAGSVSITVGLSYADVKLAIAEERERIVEQVWARAQEMLRQAGVQPGPVPLKIIVPLLQYASLEQDADLQERWAALLANSSHPSYSVQPSFPDILRQLAPADARFLDAIFALLCERIGTTLPTASWAGAIDFGTYKDLEAIWDTLGFTYQARVLRDGGLAVIDTVGPGARLALDNLCRLNLFMGRPVQRKQAVAVPTSSNDFEFSAADHYWLTPFGLEFILACHKPRRDK